jgi:hypothetical protein
MMMNQESSPGKQYFLALPQKRFEDYVIHVISNECEKS